MKFAMLIIETKKLVDQAKVLNAQIIRNLIVLFENKVHLELGFPSFFVFCVEKLGMCEATAQRKIDAMKLSRVVPDLPERIESGELSLRKVSLVSQFLRDEKKEGRDFRKKEVTAILNQVQDSRTTHGAAQYLAAQSRAQGPSRDEVTFQRGTGNMRLDFEIDEECRELLERVKSLQSHLGKRTMNETLKSLIKDYLHRNDPAQKGVRSKNKIEMQTRLFDNAPSLSRESHSPMRIIVGDQETTTKLSRESQKRTRAIPQSIRREVWNRHHGKCTYKDSKTQRVCGSSFRVQLEHKKPFSLGGTHELENLTLLCQGHNLYQAEKMGLLIKRS